MIQEIEKLDEVLDKLNDADNSRFVFENFKNLNTQIEKLLVDIKVQRLNNKNEFSKDYLTTSKNLLKKIEKIESKILPKATLLESFSKSKI